MYSAMGQRAAIKTVLGSYGGTTMLKLKKPVMTFNQFSKWCNARAADGYWDFSIALACSHICCDVCNQKWWQREKYFRENYDVEGIYKGTVCEINNIINYDRKVKKGEFE